MVEGKRKEAGLGLVVYDSYAIITRCHLATDTAFYTSWPLRFHFIFSPQNLPFSSISSYKMLHSCSTYIIHHYSLFIIHSQFEYFFYFSFPFLTLLALSNCLVLNKILKTREAKSKLRKWLFTHSLTYSMSLQNLLVKQSMGMTNLSWTTSTWVRHGTRTRALFGEPNKWINHFQNRFISPQTQLIL